ncbi:hypothetical protein [Neisseria dentiae]|uniref:hypothetical protein n=1 Tax=Neisseria dentiae TaxID=194197 RepID=UPI0035A1593F
MNIENFTHKKWALYIDGWFQHNRIEFLPDGSISNNNTEGFHRWSINKDLLEIYDERGNTSYSLQYMESPNLLVSVSQHFAENNDIFLACNYSAEELEQMFPDNPVARQIANTSALYKSPEGKIWGKIFFGIDGKIYNYHNPNEKYWKVEEGRLNIYTEHNQQALSQKFISYKDEKHKLYIKQIALDYLLGSNIHYLDFLKIHDKSGHEEPVKFLNIDACFSNRSDTLMVIFNSAGEEYDGRSVFHEFYNAPYQFAVDYIRISQSKPSRVYLDDYKRIESLIGLNGYQKIVFLGMSIGGFAAVWFAETMARKNPSVEYFSVAVQPLISLNQEFAAKIKTEFSLGYRAKTITDDITDAYEEEGLCLDLAEYLQEHIDNARHYVVYDALNKAEKFSSDRLVSDRTLMTGFDYGVGHAEGCIRIYKTDFLKPLLQTILTSS